METSKLKQFAQYARRFLRETVSAKLNVVLAQESPARRENPKAIDSLEKQIKTHGKDQVVERVAYTWFNRFCALRFMDVNRYHRTSVLSPAEGQFQPEILAEVKMGAVDEEMIPQRTAEKITGLLQNTIPSQDPQNEAYRLIVVSVCNFWHKTMPFLFQRIDDYTELLMPDDLLSGNSIISYVREAMTSDACKDVEVIGWLYQFYISEKKDEVFAGLKKNKKVTPENIPAATQLFTPNWIVRYLVENSLGRLWMLNNPGSRLIDRMEYYIQPEQEETDFLVIQSPEEIKICDPACGSGHMLVYAFEILYAIYEEQGYDAPKIPQLILKNNLYGIEIDERAGELAAFALCMKAREKYRRFFKKGIQPNVCVLENVTFKENEVKSYLDAVNPDLFTMELSTLLYQFKEADTFGSLIRPELTNISDVLRLIDEKKVTDDMFLQSIHKRVLQVLKQADYLSSKYHVVIANPPYMGGKSMNGRLGSWLKNNYSDVKSDLFSAFMVRNTELALPKGQLGFMSPFVWMFISSYKKLRHFFINKHTITSLVQLEYSGFEGATVPICTFTVENTHKPNYKGGYVKLSDFRGSNKQGPKTLEAIQNPDCGWYYTASAADFKKIPGSPIAYWVPNFNVFDLETIGNRWISGGRIKTHDGQRYIRFIWEPSKTSDRWKHSIKGGSYRKYFGNEDYLIDWSNDALEFYKKKGGIYPEKYYQKEGICWSKITSAQQSFRIKRNVTEYDSASPTIFSKDFQCDYFILALLNSIVCKILLQAINPTLNTQVADVMGLPVCVLESQHTDLVKESTKDLLRIATQDWNDYERSWDFTTLPILQNNHSTINLNNTYSTLRNQWQETTFKMQRLEEENNHIFIKAYGLKEELTPDVPLDQITLTCNPYYRYGQGKTDDEYEALLKADTMKELISYSVGCMMGRYSLDEPSIIYAHNGNEGFDPSKYNTFPADDDNVIPIMDVDWFPDDIVERFKRFLKVTFGEEHYTENITFIEKAIGKDIRKFFLKDFYTYHIKMYKKRPIYWMFSSPKGSFNALIYMHRYRPDTVSIVLNDYLREFRTKLTARKDNLENISISTSASQAEKTKALKEIEKIKKVIDEIDGYERDILYPLATKQIEIDLDDGVKENYPKFGKALKKVAGLS